MRYSEMKLSNHGEQMLKDIHKNVVDFKLNFDESCQEPTVLGTLFPNLICNGSMGIAVGMATSIPPHNASDVYKAIKLMISNELEGKETSIDDIISIIKAPDFPGGAEVISLKEIHEGYRTGRGKVVVRSKYMIEEVKGREQIVITEIPYKVNKAKLVEKIDELRRESLDSIKEIRDESDKDGTRIVIELKKDANSSWVVKKLLKQTQMQDNFSMNMVALANGKPVTFNLKDSLECFLAHVAEVITRRTQFDLDKSEKRKHLVEGILSCLDNIDEVVACIKSSETNAIIATNLQENFGLSEEQAKNIADMKLRALNMASVEDYKSELQTLNENIDKWSGIINDQEILLRTMQLEIEEISKLYEGERRTAIIDGVDIDSSDRELVKDENLVITLTSKGIIKSVSETEYMTKGRGTKGSKSSKLKDDESIEFMIMLNSRDDILFFTNKGRCHVIEAFKIPISSKSTMGKYINNYINLEPEENIVSMISKSFNTKGSDLIFVTKFGVGKRLELSSLSSRQAVTKVIGFRENDELVYATLYSKGQEVIVFTSEGQGVRFNPNANGTKGMRPMGRSAAGVNVVKLIEDDFVVGMSTVNNEESLLLVTEKGFGKRDSFEDFTTISRGGKGVISIGINEKTGKLLKAMSVKESDELFIATKNGLLSRIPIAGIRIMGRSASGVKIINLNEGDTVVSVSNNSENEGEAE